MADEVKSTFQSILSITFGAALGCVATIMTGAFGYLNKDRELDLKMIEISLTILSGDKTDNSTYARKFAIDSLAKYSGVDISEADRRDWIAFGTVPKGDFFTDGRVGGSGSWAPPDLENFSDEDHILTLGRLIFADARGQGEAARIAVANVVMNRVRSGAFPDTVAKVIYQPLQFASMSRTSDPNWRLAHDAVPGSSEVLDECLRLARAVYAGTIPDNTGNALYYHPSSLKPSWARDRTATATIGDYVFYGG